MKLPFDLRQLHYFVAVAETLSFRRASERLFISQPPLSRQIRALEEALGVRLFERSTAAVKLTREGEAALRRARKLLADAERFTRAMAKLAQDGKAPRIGASVALAVPDRKRLAAAWKKELRCARLQVEFAETSSLVPRLRRRRLDYALVGFHEGEDGEFACEPVHTIPLVAILPKAHPAARKATVALADLRTTPFFWLPRGYNPAYYDHCARIFERKGFAPPRVSVQPGQLVTLQRIAAGEGCTLMSRAQLPGLPRGAVHRPLQEGEALGIHLAALWHRDASDPERERRGRLFAAAARRVLGRRRLRSAGRRSTTDGSPS